MPTIDNYTTPPVDDPLGASATDDDSVNTSTAQPRSFLLLLSLPTTGDDGTLSTSPPPGAPELSAPTAQYSPALLAMMLRAMIAAITKLQSGVNTESIQLSQTQKQEAQQQQLAKLQEIADKLKEAAEKQKALGILGVIGKVLGLFMAIALEVVTAGAATPLVAVAVGALLAYTVVDTTLAVANQISVAAGGPPISLDALMQQMFTAISLACGDSQETADKIGQWMTFAVGIAVTLATVATGFGAAKAIGGTLARIIIRCATRAVQPFVQAAGAVVTTVQAGVGIAKASDDLGVAKAQASKLDLDIIIQMLVALLTQVLDDLKHVTERDAAAQKSATDIMQGGHEADMQQVSNFA